MKHQEAMCCYHRVHQINQVLHLRENRPKCLPPQEGHGRQAKRNCCLEFLPSPGEGTSVDLFLSLTPMLGALLHKSLFTSPFVGEVDAKRRVRGAFG
jgi:hypothetical protein